METEYAFQKGLVASFRLICVLTLLICKTVHSNDSPQSVTATVDEVVSLNGIVVESWEKGNLAIAESQARQAYDKARKLSENEDRAMAQLLMSTTAGNLARITALVGKFRESESLINEAMRIMGDSARDKSFDMATLQMNHGARLLLLGKNSESEYYLRKSMDILEGDLYRQNTQAFFLQLKSVGATHLGYVYNSAERHQEAEAYFQRAALLAGELDELLMRESGNVQGYLELINARTVLGQQKLIMGKTSEAEELLISAFAMSSRYSHEHLYYTTLLESLGGLYVNQNKNMEAHKYFELLFEKGVETFGSTSLHSIRNRRLLAQSFKRIGMYSEAKNNLVEVISKLKEKMGVTHQSLVPALATLGDIYFLEGDVEVAHSMFTEALDISATQNQLHLRQLNKSLLSRPDNGYDVSEILFRYFRSAISLRNDNSGTSSRFAKTTFLYAQEALNSRLGDSIDKMSSRQASSKNELALLVRQRQDAWAIWSSLDRHLQVWRAKSEDFRDYEKEDELSEKLNVERVRIETLDSKISKDYGKYSEYVIPASVSVDELQERILVEDEALVFILSPPDKASYNHNAFLWIVTKQDVYWEEVDIDYDTLRTEVESLRCGLDKSGWNGTAENCANLLNIDLAFAPLDGDPLPFDIERAHRLYKTLLGDVESLIDGKKLIFLNTGPLTLLPLHVLVTVQPSKAIVEGKKYSDVAWLILSHESSNIPTVAALRALRSYASKSNAELPVLGFGNPLLIGTAAHREAAELAREFNKCSNVVAYHDENPRGLEPSIKSQDGGELADPGVLLAQIPLPNTASEVCNVAANFGATSQSDIYIGARATEANLKRLAKERRLKNYRLLHFATHGSIAGQLDGMSEPGLILTPPETASSEDDGYLTSSEIAAFKLDADVVVLSACNTASGNSATAEGLGGLASSFFYAGARSLLVSNWYVNSTAAEEIVSNIFDQSRGLQYSLTKLAQSYGTASHPSYWAPFVLVGDTSALQAKPRTVH